MPSGIIPLPGVEMAELPDFLACLDAVNSPCRAIADSSSETIRCISINRDIECPLGKIADAGDFRLKSALSLSTSIPHRRQRRK